MNSFQRFQPRIERFLNKDASLSLDLRSNQLNNVITEYYDIQLPYGLIKIIIEYENDNDRIHHQYQQYVAPQLLYDHYPRRLLNLYKILNYTSSIIALTATFYHLHRWLSQAAVIHKTQTQTQIANTAAPNNNKLPKFLKLFPVPGSLIFNNLTPSLFQSSLYKSLYPSIYISIPIFLLWTGFELITNTLYFNTNKNIQKLSYYMPINNHTKLINNNLFNDWNEFFYSDNYGLSSKQFILSYNNDNKSMFIEDDEHRLIKIDENVEMDDIKYDYNDIDRDRYRYRSRENSIIIPNPRFKKLNSALPIPSLKYFLLQRNTLFSFIILHSTLLPVSRLLLNFNSLFIANKYKQASGTLQSIISHKQHNRSNIISNMSGNNASRLYKISTIMLSHTYCLLHVICTSIIPIILVRSTVFSNMSDQLINVLNPMHLNNNANAANAAIAGNNNANAVNPNDDDDDDDKIDDFNNVNVFEEYLDKWSLSNNLTSISLMLTMVPYVNNFYAMMSVFAFGMALGEGEDIMRWSTYRLLQNNIGNNKQTRTINSVWYTYYIPWISGVIGITCSFTIEVWASSNNYQMANKFKRISLLCLLLSISMLSGNRSYLESGFYLKYKSGRNIFEKITEYCVKTELAMKNFIIKMHQKNKNATRIRIQS